VEKAESNMEVINSRVLTTFSEEIPMIPDLNINKQVGLELKRIEIMTDLATIITITITTTDTMIIEMIEITTATEETTTRSITNNQTNCLVKELNQGKTVDRQLRNLQ